MYEKNNNSLIMTNSITFTKGCFDYSISYDDMNSITIICVTHNTKFLRWEKQIVHNLTDSVSDMFKITLSPKAVFNIFSNYHKGQLSETCEIILPGSDEIILCMNIVIRSRMPYHDELDIKIIKLESINVPIEELLELKLEQRDKKINELATIIDNLQIERDVLCRRVNDCLKIICNDLSNCARTQSVYSKQNYDDGLDMVAKCLEVLADGLDGCANADTVYTKEEIDKKLAAMDMSINISMSKS